MLCALSLLSLTACGTFRETSEGIVISPSGEEYEFLTYEGALYYLGEMNFEGHIFGEDKILNHMSSFARTGMYSIEGASDDIMIRVYPDSEWFAIYRKASLPEFDFSVDNCIRLEFVEGFEYPRDSTHATCGEGITDPEVIAQFLADIRSQPSSREANLYDLVEPDENGFKSAYSCATVYGFFEEEPSVAVCMIVYSYGDVAYSIQFDGGHNVLPNEWYERLKSNE